MALVSISLLILNSIILYQKKLVIKMLETREKNKVKAKRKSFLIRLKFTINAQEKKKRKKKTNEKEDISIRLLFKF